MSATDSKDKTQAVSCPAGKVAIGGGWLHNPSTGNNADRLNVSVSQPTGGSPSAPPTGWTATAVEDGNLAASWSLTTYVVCAAG